MPSVLKKKHLSHACYDSSSSGNNPGMTPYPLNAYVSDLNVFISQLAYLADVTAGVEPRYSEAIKEKVWRDYET